MRTNRTRRSRRKKTNELHPLNNELMRAMLYGECERGGKLSDLMFDFLFTDDGRLLKGYIETYKKEILAAWGSDPDLVCPWICRKWRRETARTEQIQNWRPSL